MSTTIIPQPKDPCQSPFPPLLPVGTGRQFCFNYEAVKAFRAGNHAKLLPLPGRGHTLRLKWEIGGHSDDWVPATEPIRNAIKAVGGEWIVNPEFVEAKQFQAGHTCIRGWWHVLVSPENVEAVCALLRDWGFFFDVPVRLALEIEWSAWQKAIRRGEDEREMQERWANWERTQELFGEEAFA